MLINFKKEFASMVRIRQKRQTIRAIGKRNPPRVGQSAYLYTGLRTKQCQRLGMVTIVEVLKITLEEWPSERVVKLEADGQVPRWLTVKQIKLMAQADGFNTVDDFFDFFRTTYGLPFTGYLIKW